MMIQSSALAAFFGARPAEGAPLRDDACYVHESQYSGGLAPSWILMLVALMVGACLGVCYMRWCGPNARRRSRHMNDVVDVGTPSEPPAGGREARVRALGDQFPGASPECPAVEGSAPAAWHSAANPWRMPGDDPAPPSRRMRESLLSGQSAGSAGFSTEAPAAGLAPSREALGLPNAVEGTARARIMRTVDQCRYAWWLSEPRFKPYSGAPGEWGYFAVAWAEHPAGTL
jgi:hypothetical protein